jgi:sugar-specific transcriptional regulator TrmB
LHALLLQVDRDDGRARVRTLDALRRLGLDAAAEAVYAALRRAPRTFGGLVEESGRSAADTRAALRRLTAAGLVVKSADRPAVYSAVAPEIAVSLLHAREEASLAAARDEALAWLSASSDDGSGPDASWSVRVLQGEDAVAAALRRLITSARHEAVSLCTLPHGDGSVRLVEEELDAVRRGIDWRVVYARSVLSAPGYLAEVVRPLTAAGQAVRLVDGIPTQLLLVDRIAALLPLHEADAPRGRWRCWWRTPSWCSCSWSSSNGCGLPVRRSTAPRTRHRHVAGLASCPRCSPPVSPTRSRLGS